MARLFDVRPEERRAAVLAFLALLGITAAHTLIETARDALFLARVPVAHLPALYLAIAIAGLGTTRLGAFLENRKRQKDGAGAAAGLDPVAASLAGAALITFAFWLAAAAPTRPVLYALYIYSGMFAAWVAGRLWIRLGEIFAADQAKRVYGLIGTGGVLGAVVGASVARASLVVIEVRHLLVVGAGILVLTAIGPAALLPKPAAAPVRAPRDDDDDDPAAKRSDEGLAARAKEVFGHPYLARLLVLTTLAAVVGTTIDFLFKREVAASIAKADLAPFLASVSLVTNVASLVAQAIGVTLAMRWLGVHKALYVMPLLLGAGAVSAVLGLGIYAALALRGIDGTLRHSLHKTTTELLFVPLPDAMRARAKPIVDLVGQRGGQAVASVALLGVAAIASEKVGVIAGAIVATLAVAWIGLAYTLRQRYLDVFRDTLRRGRAELSSEMPTLDIDALEALISALSSRRDAEVLGALDLLAAQERGRLVPSLVLFHPSKPIVLRALELLVREGRTDFVPAADRLLTHADADVRAAALRARAAVEPDADFLRELLDSDAQPDEIRATALAALVATAGLRPEDAREKLEAFTSSASIPVRRALARAIGEVQAPTDDASRTLLEETLRGLACDDDSRTRALAATSMARFSSPAIVDALVELLGDRRAGIAAIESLGEIGEPALAAVEAALDRTSLPAETRWRAVRALGRSTSPRAVAILARRLKDTKDTGIRTRLLHALRALASSGAKIPLERAELVAIAEQTIAQIGRALSLRLAHARLRPPERTTPGAELLASLLRDKETEGRERLFLLLGLLHPGERFARIQRGLDTSNAKTRASSRELLENILRPPLRDRVLAVVDDTSDEDRLARIGETRNEETYEALLGSMMESGGELGAIAAYHAREMGFRASTRERDANLFAEATAGT